MQQSVLMTAHARGDSILQNCLSRLETLQGDCLMGGIKGGSHVFG